jgi:hypothetical protein
MIFPDLLAAKIHSIGFCCTCCGSCCGHEPVFVMVSPEGFGPSFPGMGIRGKILQHYTWKPFMEFMRKTTYWDGLYDGCVIIANFFMKITVKSTQHAG